MELLSFSFIPAIRSGRGLSRPLTVLKPEEKDIGDALFPLRKAKTQNRKDNKAVNKESSYAKHYWRYSHRFCSVRICHRRRTVVELLAWDIVVKHCTYKCLNVTVAVGTVSLCVYNVPMLQLHGAKQTACPAYRSRHVTLCDETRCHILPHHIEHESRHYFRSLHWYFALTSVGNAVRCSYMELFVGLLDWRRLSRSTIPR